MNEKEFYKKARKLQKIREASAEFVSIPGTRIKLLIDRNENREEKIRQFKDKLNKWQNRTKN